ncbi:hypothetical protein PybrP1_000945 [[Pythium] brassicae (nom. inval.)]|nr:hypothetical protein PybrP1_000945 [[Pythium] brassicae (nom. inval.)]
MSPSAASAAQNFAAHVASAKRQQHDQRASLCSTSSTTSSSTRASDASSVRDNSRRQLPQAAPAGDFDSDDSFRDITSSLARHEAATRRRAHREQQQHNEATADEQEQDPDFLPCDSTDFKQKVSRRMKKRARRIKLKHYGLAKQAAKLNNLSGFLLHSITPRESSILTYTSMASPGTHTEYDIVVENFRTGMIWQVSRRYSTFRLLRDELAKPFLAPHCHYCASVASDMQKLEPHFPGKRLWGSTSSSVVLRRAERFLTYLRGLLAIATTGYKLNCPLIATIFVVQLRTFLTSDSVRYTGIPGQFGQQIPSLLHELSAPGSPHDPLPTLQTIQEHSSRSSRGSILLDDADERDLRDKRRLTEELDSHCLFAIGESDSNDNNRSSRAAVVGFAAYPVEEDGGDSSDWDDRLIASDQHRLRM